MRRKLLFGFVPVLTLACALFSPAVGQEGKPKKDGVNTLVACEDTNVVCPVFFWGYFGGFYQYMGYHCKDKVTVGLSSSIPLTLCHCNEAACTERCIPIGSSFADKATTSRKKRNGKPLGGSIYYTEDVLEDGIEPRDHMLANNKFLRPSTSVATSTPIGDGIPVRLFMDKEGTRSIKVALHTVKVEPKDQTVFSTKNFRVGYEFQNGSVTNYIPWGQIQSRNGRCLLVSYGGENYLVIIGKDTQEPESKTPPAAARMPKGK